MLLQDGVAARFLPTETFGELPSATKLISEQQTASDEGVSGRKSSALKISLKTREKKEAVKQRLYHSRQNARWG